MAPMDPDVSEKGVLAFHEIFWEIVCIDSNLSSRAVERISYTLIFAISYLGEHVLYWSFDTLDNLTIMEGSEQVNFDPRVKNRT